MKAKRTILGMFVAALGLGGGAMSVLAQCLPTVPGHDPTPPENWVWHHDLVTPPDCGGFVFLGGGESVEQPFSDNVNLTTRDWHVEVKTDPPGQVVCFNVFGHIYCTSIFGGLFHLTVPEPAGQETGNYVARWRNTATDPDVEFGIDSSVAEQGTGYIVLPPHDDVGGWIEVDQVPQGALVFEIERGDPTPTTTQSWGQLKNRYR